MTHASLFSGIGGFDLAAEWAGWTNMFNCEIDPFCRRVLKYHFPNAVQYEDIKTTDFTVWRGRIDVLTGGFPCQPFSVAGKRKGTDDDRYLWPEMLRAVREISPRWVVGENVRGFVNWSEGMVLDTVFSDLEAIGYEVQPFVLPACAVDAPHRRDRVWIVAHRADAGAEDMRGREELADRCRAVADAPCVGCGPGRTASNGSVQNAEIRANLHVPVERSLRERPAADTYGERREERHASGIADEASGQSSEIRSHSYAGNSFGRFPSQSPVCCGNDEFPDELDGITFPAWCRQSIKAYGNAIVPWLFYQIAKTINEYEKL